MKTWNEVNLMMIRAKAYVLHWILIFIGLIVHAVFSFKKL